MNVLHVCASPRPISESIPKQLAAAFFGKLTELNEDINVTNLDLYQTKPPFLSYDAYRAFWMPITEPGYTPTEAETRAIKYGTEHAQTLRDSDVLVMSMPLWNGGMPAIMKAWIDQVMVPGLVFNVEAGEIRPSHQVRKGIILASSGITLKQDDPADALSPQIEAFLNYIGVRDIATAWADGQDSFDAAERKEMAMEAAQDLAEEVAEMVV